MKIYLYTYTHTIKMMFSCISCTTLDCVVSLHNPPFPFQSRYGNNTFMCFHQPAPFFYFHGHRSDNHCMVHLAFTSLINPTLYMIDQRMPSFVTATIPGTLATPNTKMCTMQPKGVTTCKVKSSSSSSSMHFLGYTKECTA